MSSDAPLLMYGRQAQAPNPVFGPYRIATADHLSLLVIYLLPARTVAIVVVV